MHQRAPERGVVSAHRVCQCLARTDRGVRGRHPGGTAGQQCLSRAGSGVRIRHRVQQALDCLFPQHGAGPKHARPIVLEDWQQGVVDAHPWEFVRGLIHSDGCRVTNWTSKVVGGERKRHEYPRYFFTNKSDDIRRLYTDTLDALGVSWTYTRADTVSVARKASVCLMDAHVGAKY